MALPLYNGRFILLISASFITIFSSIAIYFCLPILISHVIRTQISLSPSSGSFNEWKMNSVIDRIYFFNITNLDYILTGGRQPIKLHQVGPFAFRQDRDKTNIKFDANNETVLYDQTKSWTFLPELSVVKDYSDLDNIIIHHINLPLSGATLSPEYSEFIQPVVTEHDMKLFLKHSANELMFTGYDDILMEQAKATGKIDVDKFGWMHNQNNSVTRNIRIFTGPSNATLGKFGTIDQFDFKDRFDVWHEYSASESSKSTNQDDSNNKSDTSTIFCNEFKSSSAGEFFPPPERSIVSHNNNPNHNQHDHHLHLHQHIYNQNKNHDNQPDLNEANLPDSAKQPLSSSEFKSSNLEQKEYAKLKLLNGGKTGKTLSLFLSDFCRTFTLFYNKTYDFKGLTVDRYIANEYTYDYSPVSAGEQSHDIVDLAKLIPPSVVNPAKKRLDNRCYCTYNETAKVSSCPPNGMMDLFMCRKGSPLTVSFPYFLYSRRDKTLAPYLRLFNDEIEPNESEHQFYIDLETTLNVPVKAQIVYQFNVHFRLEPSLNFTRDYAFLFEPIDTSTSSVSAPLTDLYLPQMWFKSSAEIDDKNISRLKFLQSHLSLVTPITAMVIFAFSSILLMMSARLAYSLTYGPKSRKSISREQGSHSSLSRSDGPYEDDKHKCHSMQLLGGDRSGGYSKHNSGGNGDGNDDYSK